MNTELIHRYQLLCAELTRLAKNANRKPPELLAVRKKQPVAAIRTLFEQGQTRFGESYWQEAEEKMSALSNLAIEWHFIGPLQSNKTRPIAEHFQWVHSVDREKVARRLSEQRPKQLAPLNVCIQVKLDDEPSKSGVTPDQLLPLAQVISGLPQLQLRGLMCIPASNSDPIKQRQPFHHLAQLQKMLADNGINTDTLSMGMSGDLAAAIEEGSTLVRVGTALFGERQP